MRVRDVGVRGDALRSVALMTQFFSDRTNLMLVGSRCGTQRDFCLLSRLQAPLSGAPPVTSGRDRGSGSQQGSGILTRVCCEERGWKLGCTCN
ncbi:unnamed protein product [Caretta caretta]